ncbi:MAG: hypothetical protein OXH83_07925 [Bryobacterales bacterium]|nr:hypothetical protein [Bryobacterales bacterium]
MPTKPTGKPRGRPALPMPEPIPDTPENVAKALFALPASHKWKFPEKGRRQQEQDSEAASDDH